MLIHYSEFINESNNDKNYERIHKEIISDYGTTLYYLAVYNSSIISLYPIMETLLKNMKLDFTLSPYQVALLTIFSIAEILHIHNDSIKKIWKKLIDSGINGLVEYVKGSLMTIKEIFSKVAITFGKVVDRFVNMLGYVSILVPVNEILKEIFIDSDINAKTMYLLFTGLGVGFAIFSIKNIVRRIISVLKRKKKNSGDMVDVHESIFETFDPELDPYLEEDETELEQIIPKDNVNGIYYLLWKKRGIFKIKTLLIGNDTVLYKNMNDDVVDKISYNEFIDDLYLSYNKYPPIFLFPENMIDSIQFRLIYQNIFGKEFDKNTDIIYDYKTF